MLCPMLRDAASCNQRHLPSCFEGLLHTLLSLIVKKTARLCRVSIRGCSRPQGREKCAGFKGMRLENEGERGLLGEGDGFGPGSHYVSRKGWGFEKREAGL